MNHLAALVLVLCSSIAFAEEPAAEPVDESPSKTAAARESVKKATARVLDVVDTLKRASSAMAFLGLVPGVECGEKRSESATRIAEALKKEATCATITQEAGADSDTVRFTFAEQGCALGKAEFKGSGAIVLTGTEKAGTVAADLAAVELGGDSRATTVAYETCAKDPAVRITTTQKGEKVSYDADLRVTRKKGAPIFGSTSVVLDGTTKIDRAGTVETATFTTLEYQPGEFLPKSGTVALSKEGGRAVTATFAKKVSRLGTATITIDGGKPVTVPIVR